MCAYVLPEITLPSARVSHNLPGHVALRYSRDVWDEGTTLLTAPPPPSSLAGGMCPFRHISGEKTVVCKHWLRGLCKKGDQCEFLHEYDMTKMPECYFYSKFGKQMPGFRSPGEASASPETQRGQATGWAPALSAISQLSGFRILGRAHQPQLAL